jgi:hypothetical protein
MTRAAEANGSVERNRVRGNALGPGRARGGARPECASAPDPRAAGGIVDKTNPRCRSATGCASRMERSGTREGFGRAVSRSKGAVQPRGPVFFLLFTGPGRTRDAQPAEVAGLQRVRSYDVGGNPLGADRRHASARSSASSHYATAALPRLRVWRTSKPSNCGWSM